MRRYRDQQTASPTACVALDGGVSTQAAAVQAYQVAETVSRIHDVRGEAGPGMPSYYGQAQGVASMAQEHLANYCDQTDVAAGLCGAVSAMPDADQQFSAYFGAGTYASQTAVNAAKDYATNLIEPVAPAALRGDQLTSVAGQDAAVRRRSFNARMSLAQSVVDQLIGMQTPSVPLTPQQQQYLQNMGLPAQTNGSWLQALQIEAERRVSDVTWASNAAGHAAGVRRARDRCRARAEQLPALPELQGCSATRNDRCCAPFRHHCTRLPAHGADADALHRLRQLSNPRNRSPWPRHQTNRAPTRWPIRAQGRANDTSAGAGGGHDRQTRRHQPGTARHNGSKDTIQEMLDRLSRAVPTLARVNPDLAQRAETILRQGAGAGQDSSSRPSDMKSPI